MAPTGVDSVAGIYQEFGRRLTQVRKSRKISQEELGEKLRLSRASIANMEAGRQRILLHHLFQLADVLSVPVNDLVGIRSKETLIALTKKSHPLAKIIKKKYPGIPDPLADWIRKVVADVYIETRR